MNIQDNSFQPKKPKGCLVTLVSIGFVFSVVVFNISSNFSGYSGIHIGGFASLMLMVWLPISGAIIGSHIEELRFAPDKHNQPYLTTALLVAIINFFTAIPLSFVAPYVLKPEMLGESFMPFFLTTVFVYTMLGVFVGLVLTALARSSYFRL